MTMKKCLSILLNRMLAPLFRNNENLTDQHIIERNVLPECLQ